MKVLLVRDDRLGDVMLTAVAVQQLHATLVAAGINATIDLLATNYTKPAAVLLQHINTVLVHRPNSYQDFFSVRRIIAHEKYDAAISFFSTTKSALLLACARIPYRLAPQTKLAQVLHTSRLRQRRSHSQKPEYQYNCDLIHRFADDFGLQYSNTPFVHHPCQAATAKPFTDAKPAIVVHPANGQSARNIAVADYAMIVEQLLSHTVEHVVVLLAGPSEQSAVDALYRLLELRGACESTLHRVIRYHSHAGVADFAANISNAQLFIAASTGTAHVAALFDVPTVVFYADVKTAGSVRWRTLNSTKKQIAINASVGTEHLHIDVHQTAKQALDLLEA